jgi:hypothetical protein
VPGQQEAGEKAPPHRTAGAARRSRTTKAGEVVHTPLVVTLGPEDVERMQSKAPIMTAEEVRVRH